jgi:hypothetical protein
VVGFSGGLNPAEAANIAEYQLTVAGKHGSFTARNAKAIKLLSTTYNEANDTATLTPTKRFRLHKPVQLVVQGTGPSGLQDSSGRLIDGNHDGQPGGSAVAILTTRGATPLAVSAGPAAIDPLAVAGELAAPAKSRRR